MRRPIIGTFAATTLGALIFAAACGGAATEVEDEDEVTTSWTAGDDAPLEGGEETQASEETVASEEVVGD